MMISIKDKVNICRLTKARAGQHSLSQSEVAVQAGVHKTMVNWIFSADEKWRGQSISDAKWRSLAAWCKHSLEGEGWKLYKNAVNYRRFYNMAQHAQEASLMIIISERFGRGKSTALRSYRDDNPKSVWYFEGESTWTQPVFVQKLCMTLGLGGVMGGIPVAFDAIVSQLNGSYRPLLIFDEWSELPESSRRLVKTLYNRTEGRCGIVLCGGEYLKKDLMAGVRSARQSYQEIFSRGGGKILGGKALTEAGARKEVAGVCALNGVEDEEAVLLICGAFTGDFREVRRLIEDYKRGMKVRMLNGKGKEDAHV